MAGSLVRRALLVAIAVGATIAVGAASASAATETASSGSVKATLSYKSAGQGRYTDLRVAVRRSGRAFRVAPSVKDCRQPYCSPSRAVGQTRRSLKVTDLDGDGDPEVIVDLYTGGAHCCTIAYILRWTGSSYRPASRNFADFGYRLARPAAAGRPATFVSGDARFAYEFASFADSAFPVQLWTFRAGRFSDVTRAHPESLRADAARWMSEYEHPGSDRSSLGVLAAWVADQYQLGQASTADAFVAGEQAAGKLTGDPQWPSAAAFVALLRRDLTAWGYAAG